MDASRREFLRSAAATTALLWLSGCGGDPKAAGGSVKAPPVWKRLGFDMMSQKPQDYWCWCATALSVHKYFDPKDKTLQCDVANKILKRKDACNDPVPKEADVPHTLDDVLKEYGHLAAPMYTAPLAWASLAAEIDQKRPVCCRVEWPDQNGHFVVIEGYLDDKTPMVAVDDPWQGPSDCTLEAFMKNYLNIGGAWKQSYKVK
jgi:papain like cysteine protease AvrRpt2